ncbi:MAG: hypothetical protein RL141_109 [Candidatus Parcubacteria bacterium]|jgi:hypothetical protein
MPIPYDHDHDNEVTLFGATNFRNQQRRFGIRTDDRRRHIYILGKTGMGKTTLLENMVLSDISAGHGVAYIDPHGDTAEKILDYIPAKRINDVVYFNPADTSFPVGFNILETVSEDQKHLVASGLMGVFKKIWPDVWSARMEYILLNCVLALLDYPGATLLGINRLLVDKEYRTRVIAKIRDPIVKTFWVAEFSSWSEKYATEAIAPVQNKVGQFLSASIVRNIVAQVKSTIDPRKIMDEGKIFIVNLSKGKIGEDNMRLLGGMIVTKIQLAAMERVDIPLEADRRDFYLFVDEFQNFANESFANILSEARKYRLNLTVAHQYIEQLAEEVRDGVFGNVGTIILFRVGAQDATFLETEFMPTFTPEDLTNLTKFQVYLKLMVDGVSTAPFSANTLAPIAQRTGSTEKVIAVSRERYAEPRADIEEKVLRWSGMEAGPVAETPLLGNAPAGAGGETGAVVYPKIQTEEEQEAREALGGIPASLVPGTPEHADAGRRALEGDGAADDTVEYLRISPERLAAISKPPAPGKKDKPKFKHTCTRCGKTWEMPIQLDPTRPMYCAECMPLMREERKTKQTIVKAAVRADAPGMSTTETTVAKPIERPKAEQNRPRLVLTDTKQLDRLADAEEDDDEESSDLVLSVAAAKGAPVETRKEAVVPPKGEVRDARPSSARAVPPPSRSSSTPVASPRPANSGGRAREGGHSQDSRPRNRPPQSRPSSERPASASRPAGSARPPRVSLEEVFRDAEDRLDLSPSGSSSGTAGKESRPSTVFRPGQRVRFDAES